MKNHIAHIIHRKWRAYISALVTVTLLVFTSSFASSSSTSSSSANMGNVLPPAYSGHVTETSPVSHSQTQMHKTVQAENSDNCCEDEKQPCADEKCDIPCMVSNVSHAVLVSVSGLLCGQNTVASALGHSVKDGISARLNAPPPRP